MKAWGDFHRMPGEPWDWWLKRHQVKVFLVCLVLFAITT